MERILVTGADGGIGSAIVETLKSAGYSVIATTAHDTDLTDAAAVATLKERVGDVDWIICSHGYIDSEHILEKQSSEAIEMTFAVNTLSLFWLARAFLPALRTGMVIISSTAGVSANGRFAAYSASKAAANAFVQALARNRPEKKFFAVAPGPTNTAMRERIAHDAAKMQSPALIAELVRDIVRGDEYHSGDVVVIKDGTRSIASRV